MYENIGRKIKILAQVIAAIGICSCILYGIYLIMNNFIKLGILFAVAGSVLSWIGSFFLYAIGELIENSDKSIELKKEKLMQDKNNFDRLIISIEKLNGVQKDEDIKENDSEKKLKKDDSEINLKKEDIKNEEDKQNLLKVFDNENVEIVETEDNILNGGNESEETLEKIKRISNLKIVSNMKNQYKDWYKSIKEFSNQELIEKIENDKDWQYPYIILCCIEYAERNGLIQKESPKNKKKEVKK